MKMESAERYAALALLEWQIELGVTEAICDAPVDRFALPAAMDAPGLAPSAAHAGAGGDAQKQPLASPVVQRSAQTDPVAAAERAAAAAQSLDELRQTIADFPHCDLRRGGRSLVFGDGIAGAPLMVLGEAPDKEEDRTGTPFAGQAGVLLDRMLGAIGRGRADEEAPVYLATALPWRPPQGREPKPGEIAMLRPFLLRHVALAKPKVLAVMGNGACQVLLGRRGVARLRGNWTEAAGVPTLPMYHPGYLLRYPEFKRDAWADLQALQRKLRDG